MKVFIVVQHEPDVNGGIDSTIRGVYSDDAYAQEMSCTDSGDHYVEEWVVNNNTYQKVNK